MTRCVVKLTSNIQDPVQADRMIDENYYYVDGIRFTYMHAIILENTSGLFAAAQDEVSTFAYDKFPTNIDMATPPPEFVGNDYFCGHCKFMIIASRRCFYTDDPLWDGTGCGPANTCCSLTILLGVRQRPTIQLFNTVCRNFQENGFLNTSSPHYPRTLEQ